MERVFREVKFCRNLLQFLTVKLKNCINQGEVTMKLRELRKQNELSMKDLGKLLGMSESAISLYENGKREPDIATLITIADIFNVSVDELLGLESTPKKEQRNINNMRKTNSYGQSDVEKIIGRTVTETIKQLLPLIEKRKANRLL